MAEAHVGPLPEGLKHCPICAEPINKRARKCIHCQSDLAGWRRRFGFSATILSLLIALVSVITSAAPVLFVTRMPDDSLIVGSFQAADRDTVTIMVSNLGPRPGTIRGGYISIVGDSHTSIDLSFKDNMGPRILEPGKSMLVTFDGSSSINSGTKIFDRSFFMGKQCEVGPQFTSFQGLYGLMKTPEIDCDLLREFTGTLLESK